MNVLIVGQGGREHAIAVAVRKSRLASKVYVAPGNGGTAAEYRIENVQLDIKPPFGAVIKFAYDKSIGLVVVGPEQPLADGLADKLTSAGVKCFGPTADAAAIETSKEIAKALMTDWGIPTAPYGVFSAGEYGEAVDYVDSLDYPIVIKASGLAAGKGVIVDDGGNGKASKIMTLRKFIDDDKIPAKAKERFIIEKKLIGREVSVFAFADGTDIIEMISAHDYKRLNNGGVGPMTGGMGAYAPADVSDEMLSVIGDRVLKPAIAGMKKSGCPFVGILYAGIMLTNDGPFVLEFNCRMGDPEAQSVLPLLQTDIVEVMLACVEGRLASTFPNGLQWRNEYSVSVVMASGGYPNDYINGFLVSGASVEPIDSTKVFHAGTIFRNNAFMTNGGRVLTVTSVAKDIRTAKRLAYERVSQIDFHNMSYRTDIGDYKGPKSQNAWKKSTPPISISRTSNRIQQLHRSLSGSIAPVRGGFSPVIPNRGIVGSAGSRSRRTSNRYSVTPVSHYDSIPKFLSGSENIVDTYKKSGVDVDLADQIVETIKPIVRRTSRPGCSAEIGGFGGICDLYPLRYKDPLLISGTDGVGTKLQMAEDTGNFSGIGIDLVAMCVNDVLVHGAEPLYFLDYLSMTSLDESVIESIIRSIASGCTMAGCALIGGETAEMPLGRTHVNVNANVSNTRVHLAGFATGIVEREQLLPRPVSPGDMLIGVKSSGLHANGFSLVRSILTAKSIGCLETAPWDRTKTVGESLLTPTRIYVRELLSLVRGGKLRALAHITGGGITGNLRRVLGPYSAEIDLGWDLPSVFQWLQEAGGVTTDEMLRVFNCGIGMILIVDPIYYSEVINKVSDAVLIGYVGSDNKKINYVGEFGERRRSRRIGNYSKIPTPLTRRTTA